MNRNRGKRNRLVSLYLALSLVPLTLVGAALVLVSFHGLTSETKAQQQQILHQARLLVSHRIDSWKNILRITGTVSDLTSSIPAQQEKFIQQLFYQFPDLHSVQLLSDQGNILVRSLRPGLIRPYQVPTNEKALLTIVKQQKMWQGPVQFTDEGFPRLPLMLSLASPRDKNSQLYLLMEFSLEPLSQLLQELTSNVGIREGHRWLAHSRPLAVFSQKEKSVPGDRRLTLPLTEYGWTIELNESWSNRYKPTLFLLGEIILAIFLVGFVTTLVGMRASKKAEQRIAQQERLSTIGQMASVISHEIRTALAVIKNSLSFIKEHLVDTDPRSTRNIEIMETQIKATDRILSDILGFARVRELNLKPMDVNQALEDILTSLPIPNSVFVEKTFSHDLTLLTIDPDEFKQAVSNIVLNAIQAMEGEGRLHIQTLQKNQLVQITIRDTGPGIASDIQKKIFDPFYTTKSQGTGLGLAIVKRVMDRHRGKIDLKSKPGLGTTVQLLFPCQIFLDSHPTTTNGVTVS